MNFQINLADRLDEKELPLSIYDSVVRTLFSDQLTLILGMSILTVAPISLFWKTSDVGQLVFAVLFLALGMIRIVVTRRFQANTDQHMGRKKLQQWEHRYAMAGTAYMAALGAWFFYGFARSSDEFVHMLTLALLLCFLVGTMGRNFSSDKVVWQQVLATGVPMFLAFTLFGSGYYVAMGALLFPFFMAIWVLSARLRRMLFDAVVSAHDQKVIADRFNIALDHIAQGVAMFDRSGNIVVANARFGDYIGYRDGALIGHNLKSIKSTPACLSGDGKTRTGFLAEIRTALKSKKSQRFSFITDKSESIEVDFYPMPKGGVVFLRDISEQVASEEAIRELASFDPLTKLPNRRSFVNNIVRLTDEDGAMIESAMFFVDLDKFKAINDSLGHAVGDQMLVIIADRLKDIVPDSGLICRFGGDEFVIVVPGLSTEGQCEAFAATLIGEISKPLSVDAHDIRTGATVGISMCPINGTNVDQLLKTSDAALYSAKSIGRGSYSFYTDSLGESIQERRQLETDLRAAVENETLALHFQPLVSVHKKRITTCEALLRWEHPVRGSISPALFIPIAEEIGIISQLSDFVLKRAIKACQGWPEGVNVAVNISSLQFQQSDVHASVETQLRESGLDPRRLEIEVTESAMLGDVADATSTLKRLKKLGVRISLDDFGTGFSSLSYLHSLPLDKVKIDRSFIKGILKNKRSQTLLKGVTRLTHHLGLKIVVEGIETEEQMELLCEEINVDEMQGFLFGRALPPRDIQTLLNSDRRWQIGENKESSVA